MAYLFEIKPELAEKLRKIKKKNFLLFQRVQKKIAEIIEKPNHYKPLKYDMKSTRRVHLDPFVLIFSVNENERLIEFLDLDHHDKIYKR